MVYKHGKHEIEIFDTVENLPVKRFQKFNKLQILSSDVGSDFTDFQQRIIKISQYVQKDMRDFALKELENFNLSLFNGIEEVSPRSMSFAVLVKRIDQTIYKEFSENDLERCLKHLDNIEFDKEAAQKLLREVKKNLKRN